VFLTAVDLKQHKQKTMGVILLCCLVHV
jgi:hypothetical protein